MTRFRQLDDKLLVSPQIAPEDIEQAASEGVRLVINNRPDGEAPDQPPGAAIEAAARKAGIDYRAIPVGHGGFSAPQVEATREALDKAEGKALAFCRSGTRSTMLWALAQASKGENPDILAARAQEAGYDLAPIRALLDMFYAQARGNSAQNGAEGDQRR